MSVSTTGATPPPPPPPPPSPPGPAAGPERVPRAQAITCTQCGAPCEVRTFGRALSVVCGRCRSVLDSRDPRHEVLQKKQSDAAPTLPLGSRGTLRGTMWEVTGWQRREVEVEGEVFAWEEHVLFNPYSGFRYLVHYMGHWSFVEPLDALPDEQHSLAVFEGQAYKHFQTATARTAAILGEFPWRAAVGERAECADFVAPPFMLSRERTPEEVTWSRGEYVEPKEVRAAFRPKGTLPGRSGVYANQPSPFRPSGWLAAGFLLVALLVAAWMAVAVVSSKERVFSESYTLELKEAGGTSAADPFVTEVFELKGGRTGVEITTAAGVANSWVYVNYALINEDTGNAIEFGREVAYYSGRDSDGPWTEGSQTDTVLIPAVPAGRYYLRVEPEGSRSSGPLNCRIAVRRGVPSAVPFVAVLLLLLAPPVVSALASWNFEVRRWSESDHPMTSS